LIDTPAPHSFQPTGRDWSEAQWLTQVSQIVSHLYGVEVALQDGDLAGLDDEAQMALLHGRLIAAGVLPEGSDLAYFRGFVNVYKANLRVAYAPAPLAGELPVLLLRSLQEQPQHLASEQYASVRAAEALGWTQYFARPVTVRDVPGDHLTMMRGANTATMAAVLEEFLAAGSAG
jgi:thioesterase domain-containing protein